MAGRRPLQLRSPRNGIRFAALALLVGAATACIEGHERSGSLDGILGPDAGGRDPAAISEISGRVLVRGTTTPIPGARLVVGAIEAISGPDGTYRLGGIVARVVMIEATSDGYQPRSITLPLAAGSNAFTVVLQPDGP